MSLTQCPACSRDVSTQAPSCPNCGQPLHTYNPARYAWLMGQVLGIFLILGGLGAMAAGMGRAGLAVFGLGLAWSVVARLGAVFAEKH